MTFDTRFAHDGVTMSLLDYFTDCTCLGDGEFVVRLLEFEEVQHGVR
jgi:acyl-coenzyme A thioesterase PaaI-like protein